MAVRTARLGVGTVATNTTVTVVSCGAGQTIIVKDIRFANTSTGSTSFILAAVSGPRSSWLSTGILQANSVVSLPGFIVLEPGDTIVLFTANHPLDYWISGAELAGVAP